MQQPKRALVIQDLSGFGRCSMTVILPTLSAMGVQVCPVPTAILSTHFGNLGNVVQRDLTDYLLPTLEHYQQLELEMDSVYLGYLASEEQVAHGIAYLNAYPSAFRLVDPVMGDHGTAYRSVTVAHQQAMKALISHGDLITPNLTELCLLLEEPYPTQGMTEEEVVDLLTQLSTKTKGDIVLTGVEVTQGQLSNFIYLQQKRQFWRVDCPKVASSYPGTGDLFASLLLGGVLQGKSLVQATEVATDFLHFVIRETHEAGTDSRYGVLLEPCLSRLLLPQPPAVQGRML